MGLLDSVLANVLGGSAGGASSPMGTILSGLLGGGGAMGGFGNQGYGNPGAGGLGSGMGGGGLAGGLGGLLAQFQNAGLGNIAQSWVSNGPNQPISPQQLQTALGEQQVQGMANQAGMDQGDFLAQLSQHLPNAVHHMTPDGRLPDEGSIQV